MTDLPTRIEACEATDAEVATALGYRSAPDGYGMGDDWFAPGVNYVTAEEAQAICLNYGPFSCATVHVEDLTVSLPARDKVFRLPLETAHRYIDDWKRSGLWSLPGTKAQQP